MGQHPQQHIKKYFFVLWILCVVGAWSVLPYVKHLGVLPNTVSMGKVVLLATAQAVFFYGLICWLSFKILPKTDLDPFSYQNFFKQIVCPGIISGALVGSAILICDKTIFHSSLLSGLHPPLWIGVLASIYGGINEEVLLRLFLFTLIYLLFRKFTKFGRSNKLVIFWSVNVLVALLFGIGHLPAAFKLAPPSVAEVSRVLFLNGIGGVVFGWLYWSRGLWTAIVAHFVADLFVHGLMI